MHRGRLAAGRRRPAGRDRGDGLAGEATARVSRVLPGWSVEQAKRLGASAAKLLVYYHPDAANAAEQERFVADVAAQCRAADFALFVEPLGFDPVTGGKLAGEARRRCVIETARHLTALGPDVLKAEFPYDVSVTDEGAWRTPAPSWTTRAGSRGSCSRAAWMTPRSSGRSPRPVGPGRPACWLAVRSGRRPPRWPRPSATRGSPARAAAAWSDWSGSWTNRVGRGMNAPTT